MSDTLNPNIDRRSFIRGTSSFLGAAALSSSGISSLLPKPSEISVAFVEGDRLVSAEQVRGAAVPFERAQLTVSSMGKGSLSCVKAHFEVLTKTTARRFPFLAWVNGGARTRFEMPVGLKTGLNLSVVQKTRMGEETTDLQFGPASKFKLNEGTYVIAPGKVNWSTLRVASGALVGVSGTPAALQHVFVTVDRA